jgi:hypothetical protein
LANSAEYSQAYIDRQGLLLSRLGIFLIDRTKGNP